MKSASPQPSRYLNKIKLRPLRNDELALATAWAVNEGWNPGLADASVFNAADPGSLITAEVDGEPVGAISCARMSADFGFVGFYVLPPEYRISRFAWSLMQASLDRMEDRTIGVDGVPARVRTYLNHGLTPAFNTHSHHGIAPSEPKAWRAGVEPAAGTPLAELAAYDAAGFGVSRIAFLREWLTLPGSLALVFKHEGRLAGFGAARRCHRGIRVGPLQADAPEIAEALLDALLALAPGEPFSIDCPDTNPDAARLFQTKGLTSHIATIRLYRGPPPVTRAGQVYGQMSFALG